MCIMKDDIDYSSVIKFANELQSFKASLPYRMNVIRSAARGQLKEIAHSMILADLLNVEFIQIDFLNTFLPDSNVLNPVGGKYKVERENNYIDICLENDTTTIIIENKVNGAPERLEQIYRYVCNSLNRGAKNVFVLYLNAISYARPSDRSLKNEKGESVFQKISEEHFKVVSYAYDILPWLQRLLCKYSEELKDFQSAIIQYIEYLQLKFDINCKIMDKINLLLGIKDSFSYDDKIQYCNNQATAISSCLNEIEKYVNHIIISATSKWKSELEEIFENCEFQEHKGDDKFGWVVKYKNGIELVFTTTNGIPWWGIRLNGYSKKASVLQALKQKFLDTENNSYWDIYKYSKYSTIMTEAKQIFEMLRGVSL